MKKLSFIFLSVIFILTGCTDRMDSGTIQLVNPEDSELHFSAEGGRVKVSVLATGEWGAETEADWCIVAPSRARKEDSVLTVLVGRNSTSEEREGTVTLNSADFSFQIRLVQDGLQEQDEQTPEAEQPSAEGETFLVVVSHEVQNFRMPVFPEGFSGMILWGDGHSDDYAASTTGHTYYDSAEKSVVIQLDGEPEKFEMHFESLEGILSIDLSGLPL